MWPFNSAGLKLPSTDEDLSEEQVAQLFNLASKPASSAASSAAQPASSASGPSSATAVKDRPAIPDAEPCSLQYYFDEFFMCYTPKSQLRNWYRYGEQKDCSERWRDLKWCISTRMTDEEHAQAMLRKRQIDVLKKVRSGPNSEDVWEIRKGGMPASPWKGPEAGEDYSIS